MRDFIKVMKALSDPGRVKMLKMLESGELCVCEVQQAMGLSQPTVSKHLRQLEDAGLVQSRKQGAWVLYTLCPDGTGYAETMLRELAGWLNRDPEVRELMERLPEACRTGACTDQGE